MLCFCCSFLLHQGEGPPAPPIGENITAVENRLTKLGGEGRNKVKQQHNDPRRIAHPGSC